MTLRQKKKHAPWADSSEFDLSDVDVDVDRYYSVENVLGSEFDDTLTGNSAANELAGGDGNDRLSGGGGNDTIDGGLGDDRLTGGGGNDTFIFANGYGNDTITDFVTGAATNDRIDVSDFDGEFDDLTDILAAATDNGDYVTIDFGGDTLTLLNVNEADLHADDFLF